MDEGVPEEQDDDDDDEEEEEDDNDDNLIDEVFILTFCCISYLSPVLIPAIT